MAELTEQDRNFFDLFARLIDAPLQRHDENSVTPELQIQSRLRQLPYTVEYSVISHLHQEAPDLFLASPSDRFPYASYIDANDDQENAGAYFQGRSFLIGYRFTETAAALAGSIGRGATDGVLHRQIDEWMEGHNLFESSEDHPDPHFAERAFVVNVFVPAFGAQSLRFLQPQKAFHPYVVDFELRTSAGRVIIEVDGREYHDRSRVSQNRFEYELRRQNDLQALNIQLFRFAARRVLQEPEAVVHELRQLVVLPQQMELFEAGEQLDADKGIGLLFETLHLAEWFRPVQLSILLSLSRSLGNEEFRIIDNGSESTLLFLACHDLYHLADQVQTLFGVTVQLPKTVRILGSGDPNQQIINRYLQAAEYGPDGRNTDRPPVAVVFERSGHNTHCDSCDLLVDLDREGRIPLLPEGGTMDVLGRESKNLATLRARLKAMTLERPGRRNPLRPMCLKKQLIDGFARRYLRIPALYHHRDVDSPKSEERQYELVRRVLQGLPVFGIMPTGRGKSVAFQLPALLLPGGAIVVSPLRALMRDQLDDLKRARGVNTAEAIQYGMVREERDQAIDDFLYGYTKILYVSPERLQEIRFSTRLAQAASSAHVSFVAVDEAHCVSEWGHDFRLSYMHVPNFMEDLRYAQAGDGCPTVALTATASPPVRLDVCSILRLNEMDARDGGDFIAEANIDRTELSLSVHSITGHSYPADRQAGLKNVLMDVIPAALKHNHGISEWRQVANGQWNGTGSGVVFCLYKDSHGQKSWHESVGAVRDYLLASDLLSDATVRIYAADSPGYCPECNRDGHIVYTLRGLTRADVPKEANGNDDSFGFECINGHRFTRPLRHDRWDETLSATQHEFKSNAFPVMVSTKAYGMGIDHRGLRFVVHYGLPSSLEAYYQEIGRAGRDDRQAHCALLVRPPADACIKYLERPVASESYEDADDSDLLPPCLRGEARTRRMCPPEIGLPEPCDLSRQLMMMIDSYKKPEGYADKCVRVWAELVTERRDSEGRVAVLVRGGGMHGERRVAAYHNHLYRLHQLGIVRTFRLEYVPAGDHFNTRFHVSLPTQTHATTILEKLAEWLSKIRRVSAMKSDGNEHRDVAECLANLHAEAPSEDGAHEVNGPLVRWAARKLFGAIRAHVIKMRLESFAKLHRYIKSDHNCRRLELLGGMTGQPFGEDSHKCGFCDSQSCTPDRTFSAERARPVGNGIQFRDLFGKVTATINSEDTTDAVSIVKEAQARHCLIALGHQATSHLESFPDNLAANLIAAESYRRNPDESLRGFSHRYFRQFARVANVEKRNAEDARRGYDAYKGHDPAEAIRVYAVAGSAMDNERDLALLAADSANHELESAERDHLKVAALATKLHKLGYWFTLIPGPADNPSTDRLA